MTGLLARVERLALWLTGGLVLVGAVVPGGGAWALRESIPAVRERLGLSSIFSCS